MIIMRLRTPVDCDADTLRWMNDVGLDLPTMLCNAGLWASPDEVVIHKHQSVVREGARSWAIHLQARERVRPWGQEEISQNGPSFETIIMKPYLFRSEDGRSVTIYAATKIHERFGLPTDYDSDDFCCIKKVAEIWWATTRRFLTR